MLRPCQYRRVSERGQLICSKILRGDPEVTPDVCELCPVMEIDCRHLRFALEKRESGAIIVRYGNGRTEVWEGEPATVRLQRAACSVLTLPVAGPQTCAGCALHSPMSEPDEQAATRTSSRARHGTAKVLAMPIG